MTKGASHGRNSRGKGGEHALETEEGAEREPQGGNELGIFKTQENCHCGQSAKKGRSRDEAGARWRHLKP